MNWVAPTTVASVCVQLLGCTQLWRLSDVCEVSVVIKDCVSIHFCGLMVYVWTHFNARVCIFQVSFKKKKVERNGKIQPTKLPQFRIYTFFWSVEVIFTFFEKELMDVMGDGNVFQVRSGRKRKRRSCFRCRHLRRYSHISWFCFHV